MAQRKRLPQVAIADIYLDYQSQNLIESKSFKLYLNSFNQSKFTDFNAVQQTMQRDLIRMCAGDVKVRLNPVAVYDAQKLSIYKAIALMNKILKLLATNLTLLG